MISSHVTGWLMSSPAFSTKDLRYQSTCVFDQNGAATSSPSQVAAVVAPLKDCSSSFVARSCGILARYPALANSAVYGGSRLIRSMLVSCAASRRASWMRCWLASCGSTCVSIVYSSVLHFSAIASWPPASGLMYQVIVLPEPLLQATRAEDIAAVTAPRAIRLRRTRALSARDEGAAIGEPPLRVTCLTSCQWL